MRVTKEVADILNLTFDVAVREHHEYVTPELLLYEIAAQDTFREAFENCGGDTDILRQNLRNYLEQHMAAGSLDDGPEEEDGPEDSAAEEQTFDEERPEMTAGFENVLIRAQETADNCGKDAVELSHLVYGFYSLEESYAIYYMESQGVGKTALLQELSEIYDRIYERYQERKAQRELEKNGSGRGKQDSGNGRGKGAEDKSTRGRGETEPSGTGDEFGGQDAGEAQPGRSSRWRRYVTCLNENLEGVNPLIGREDELERTMQILCRKEKNNPLHIGEPGVGKTAIVYGLARLLEEGKVPDPLKGATIFTLDLGTLLAGTQYRGDFEKRFREIMDGVMKEEKPILYIDEIHNIVGAGAVNGGSFDVSNMLKPYLAAGEIRFIGATTYEEYKKHFEKSKSLVRRFQNVEIKEPSEEDTVKILEGLKKHYESYHGVKYGKGVLEYAVKMSARYINERYLPDKAIDLIDEAGAYRRLHPQDQKTQTVGKGLIDEILSKTCQIPKQVVESDEVKKLATLDRRISTNVFGQDEAVGQVVNAVKFSRAGLLEAGKPLASLLFVGPTGVGKTEIAKTLAQELGIRLIRYDMSEYEEKHAVAKLIGAPAGYVGYEEGGLLTEEIRKNPHAVLLLDEIEKAHPDIYNILLQVMDYATLTDNQGRKADFRNIILIMTSNAGASQIGKSQIGFGERTVKSDIIMDEVKKTFQPEFRNRLNRIVVFNAMDDRMAAAIVDKKLRELGTMLDDKKVQFTVTDAAKALLKQKGISQEYGAREIERVIGSEIKPLLVDEILFGSLKRGGDCLLDCKDGAFTIKAGKRKG
ncbi:AAA family ATPase [[Clostridium] symbiosum]|uniref:AAA family ATPase n=1 Tax=Clostridium symbiosum TaxID=1512 RepID=UPI001D09324A|nr:AAA family ATPase [[Clostridium] symbiosum]MCB6611186.1 ATP-dependent Clp protease ATP-binding subunit [[Clostridium] symbiosum]MCB6933303.1 ATP-dependent Clp protease ATP-binding subunit [[Clostridium] symbiosum]